MSYNVLGKNGNPHEYDTLLGKTQTGEEIWVSQKDRRRGMYCLGGTGMGKSKLVTSTVIQDLSQRIPMRKGFEANIGVCVIAPDSDLINDILLKIPKHREEDIILLDPLDTDFPFPLNLFNCPNPSDPKMFELTVEQVISVFEKVFGMSDEITPQLSEYVQAITRTLVGSPYTMTEISHLLTNEGFRKRVVDPTSDFWMDYNAMQQRDQHQEYRTTIRRIRQLTENQIIRNIVGQTGMLDFSEIINKHKILLVDLAGEYEHLGKLLGSIIIGQLLLAALKQKHLPENQRPYFNLYVDEFQNYATPAMNKLLTECRKYRIGSCVLHQSLYQPGITDGIRATTRNVSTFVFFKLTNVDAEELASVFDITPPQALKPPPVIPANVLNHLHRHPHEAVKSFWRQYVQRWEEAAKKQEKERVRSTTEWYALGPEQYEETITTYPEFDMGEGVVLFEQRDIKEILLLVNDLLYETQVNGTVPTQKRIALIQSVAHFLFFPTFYRHSYLQTAYYSFEQSLRAIRQTREEAIAKQEAEIAEKEKALVSDDAFLSLHLRGIWRIRPRKYADVRKEWYTVPDHQISEISNVFQRDDIVLREVNGSTKEALWISMQRAAAENKQLMAFSKYEYWLAARKDMLQKKVEQLQQERTQEAIRLAPYARVQEEHYRKARRGRIQLSWLIKRCIFAVALCVVAVWCFSKVIMPFMGEVPWSTGNIIWVFVLGIIGVLSAIRASYLLITTIRKTIDGTAPKVPGDPYYERYSFLSSMALNPTWKREVTVSRSPLFTMPIFLPPPGFFARLLSSDSSPVNLASIDFSSCESVVKLDERINEIQQLLRSDKEMLAYPYDVYHPNALKKAFILELADTCLLYSSSDTAERILALNKELYRTEVIKPLQEKVAAAKNKLSFELAALRAKLIAEQAPHDRFVNALDAVLSVLVTSEGRIAIPSTEWVDTPISQQTHADREREISNILTNKLIPRQAMVKTPQGEWLIETPTVDGRPGGLKQKRQKALENTRATYHFPTRKEVEQEIANRIRSVNPQPTQRKHTLE